MSTSPNFCRLCLQKSTGPFKALNSDLKTSSMLKNLFPGMNMDLVEKSKICNECFKYIQFSYTMRETVIKNEQKMISNMELIKNIEENTCRLCLNTRIPEGTVFLYENVDQTMSFLEARSIIEIAIVTMRYEIFKKPVVCNCCWKIIKLIYLFKKRCFATEKILKFYCTKNNLDFLSNKDMESVGNCYNSNLQKFSKGDKLNLLANLVPRENLDNTSQTPLSSVGSIIKPVDVYLNNFTSEDEDDVFDEEVDDIFVESPLIVKKEPLNTMTEQGEQQNTNLDQRSEYLEQLNQVAVEIKREEAKDLNYTPNDIQEKGVIIKNSPEKKVSNKNYFKKSPIKYMEVTTSAESTERVNNGSKGKRTEGDLETMEIRAESSEISSNTSKILKETEILAEEINTKIKKSSSENSSLIETENQNIEQSVQKRKTLEHNKKGQKKSENLEDNNVSRKSDQKYQETIKLTRKRKNPFEELEDSIKASNNNSEANQNELLEPIVKKLRNKPEKLESMKVSAKLEKKIKRKKINKHEIKIKKSGELIGKKMTKDDGETEWCCNQCAFTTKYRQHLQRHNLIHNRNGEMLTCSHCVYSTYIKRNLERHMLVHSAQNFMNCAHCLFFTVNKSHLKKHMMKHRDIDPKGYRYNTDSDTGQKNNPLGFRCNECPFVTSKEVQIVSHLRTHKSQEKVLKCKECHYITTRTHSLKDHMELHNKDSLKHKAFQCKLCSFTGKRRTHLESHMLTHEKDFKFNCSECSYKAKRKNHLVTHMLRHQSGVKKIMYQCPHCKYKSIRRDHLKSHWRNMHPDKEEVDWRTAQVAVENDDDGSIKEQKTARCPYCPYRYHTSNQRIVHIFTGHFPSESKEMHCNDCSYKTDIRRLFMRHLYNVHGSNGRKKCSVGN